LRSTHVSGGWANHTETWRARVPTGRYFVTVCAGDPDSGSVQHVKIQSRQVIDAVATKPGEFCERKDIPVEIKDGELTVVIGGCGERAPAGISRETALNYVVIRKASKVADPYPLKQSPGAKYLVDQSGNPFLIHGDVAWSLLAQLTREEAELYLENRRLKGFNTVMVSLMVRKYSSNPPKNRYGDEPFLRPGDFSTPNNAYFAHVDWVISKAAERGIQLLVAPAWIGYEGVGEGWYEDMIVNGMTKLRNYGRYLGNRYKNFNNIIWLDGGNRNPPNRDVVRWVAEGIRETDTRHLHAVHCNRETSGLEYWAGETWLDVNTTYTSSLVYQKALADYNRANFKPFFLMEAYFEGERDSTPRQVRAQAYYALLSGAMGQFVGNRPLWLFDPGWQAAMDGQASRDMVRVKGVLAPRAWYTLAPDQTHVVVTSGRGTMGTSDYVAAAMASDGSLALAYLPSPRTVTVDMTRFWAGVTASWYDPTDASYTAVAGSPFPNAGTMQFASPKRNSVGDGDFVLVLEATTSDPRR
jgi:hypothetical protein